MTTRFLILFAIILVPFCVQADDRHASILLEEMLYDEAPFPSCHASSIEEVEEGVFLTAFFGGTHEKHPDVGIWLSRRDQNGWSAPHEVAQYEGVPTWNPVLFRMPDDELLLFYKAGPSPQTWTGFLKRSTDAGKTWSESEMLPAGIHGPIRSKPILRKDGSLLCGSSIESWRAWTCWMDWTPDAGRTWEKYGPIVVPGIGYHIIQPTLFYDSEGHIRMLARSSDPRNVVTAVSEDEGRTWSDATPIDLPNPSAGVDAVSLPDGRVALIYNHQPAGRQNLSIAVSSDDGETWSRVLSLEDQDGEYSYPAMILGSDGNLHATYTYQRRQIKYVVMDPTRF